MSGLLFFLFQKKKKGKLSALRFLVLGQYKKHLSNLPPVLRSRGSLGERTTLVAKMFSISGPAFIQFINRLPKVDLAYKHQKVEEKEATKKEQKQK